MCYYGCINKHTETKMSYRPAFSNARSAKSAAKVGYPILTVDIFALACVAQRINGQYVKETHTVYPGGNPWNADGSEAPYTVVKANKIMVREWLAKKDMSVVTDADRSEAEAVRGYWQLKLFNVLSGTASDYEKSAVESASAAEIDSHDQQKIGLISSLPAAYERGMVRDQRLEARQEAAFGSQHFGRIGDAVAGEVRIIDCIYSQNWSCYYVTGTFNGNMVMFTARSAVDAGKVFQMKGKVKKHRDENITQLNYVKLK